MAKRKIKFTLATDVNPHSEKYCRLHIKPGCTASPTDANFCSVFLIRKAQSPADSYTATPLKRDDTGWLRCNACVVTGHAAREMRKT